VAASPQSVRRYSIILIHFKAKTTIIYVIFSECGSSRELNQTIKIQFNLKKVLYGKGFEPVTVVKFAGLSHVEVTNKNKASAKD